MSFYKINVTLDLNSHEVFLSKVKIDIDVTSGCD